MREDFNLELSRGSPIERDDGRFYIPIYSNDASDPIIMRVSTDAFKGNLNLAIKFADEIVYRWNLKVENDDSWERSYESWDDSWN